MVGPAVRDCVPIIVVELVVRTGLLVVAKIAQPAAVVSSATAVVIADPAAMAVIAAAARHSPPGYFALFPVTGEVLHRWGSAHHFLTVQSDNRNKTFSDRLPLSRCGKKTTKSLASWMNTAPS